MSDPHRFTANKVVVQNALKGKGLRSGPYDGPAGESVLELRVGFSLSDAALRDLRDGCGMVFREACGFRTVGRRLT